MNAKAVHVELIFAMVRGWLFYHFFFFSRSSCLLFHVNQDDCNGTIGVDVLFCNESYVIGFLILAFALIFPLVGTKMIVNDVQQ